MRRDRDRNGGQVMKSNRKSIREWLGKEMKDYGEAQREFLKISLYDYCRYLEALCGNKDVRIMYEEIREYTGAEKDTDMNHVLRLLVNTISGNAGNYADDSPEAIRYDWAQQMIYELLVAPFFYQEAAIKTSKEQIQNKIDRFEHEYQTKRED